MFGCWKLASLDEYGWAEVANFCDTRLFEAAFSSCALIGCFEDCLRMASQGIGLPIIPDGIWFLTELRESVAASRASLCSAVAAVVVRQRSTV